MPLSQIVSSTPHSGSSRPVTSADLFPMWVPAVHDFLGELFPDGETAEPRATVINMVIACNLYSWVRHRVSVSVGIDVGTGWARAGRSLSSRDGLSGHMFSVLAIVWFLLCHAQGFFSECFFSVPVRPSVPREIPPFID